MAYISFALFFLTTLGFATVLEAAQRGQSNISLNSFLHPITSPTSWFSPSGRFAFGFYPEGSGFLVGVWFVASPGNSTVIWTADRDKGSFPKDATLKLSVDGLKVLNARSEDRPISHFSKEASSASLLDTGNFIIYDPAFNIIWQTFDLPTDTIMAGQALSSNDELISSVSETSSSNGRYRIKMQGDGNLVSYPVDTEDTAENAYYASRTNGENYNSLNLDDSGRMYLLSDNATMNLTNRSSRSPMLVYRARLGSDGVFRLYVQDLETNKTQTLSSFPDWSNKCKIKGSCGLNSYCTNTNDQPVCTCFPGFSYVDTNNTLNGCTQNFTINGCPMDKDSLTYSMSNLDDILWLDDPYSIATQFVNASECNNACLEDCNCDAVLFYTSDNQCSKQKLPLRYGYRQQDSDHSTLAFIKTGYRSSSVDGAAGLSTAVPKTRIKKELNVQILIVCIAANAGLITALLGISFFIYKRRVGRYQHIWENKELGLNDEIAPRSFSYHELREATDGFKEELGKGAFGTVFKGTLWNGEKTIAVKRLEKVMEEGEREFRTEMRAIGRTHHRNLVRLFGFCVEGSNRLLVYEYMSNGSLADLIFRAEGRPSWDERVGFALDVAKGIHYLHEECENRIIHCDIKPQNILMDDNWTAKISDFGMAKMLMPSQTRTFTGIRGTRGYLAPEWHENAPISVKADIYSFGIVLLEIICCRKTIEIEAEIDEIVLSEWVYKCFLAGELEVLLKNEEVDVELLDKLVKVALWCIQAKPAFRPSMKNVVLMLEGHINISLPPPPSPIF